MRQLRLAKGEGLYRFSSVKLGEGSQTVQLALSRREQFGELARGDSNSSIKFEKVDRNALTVMKRKAQKQAVKMLSGSLLPVLEAGSFLQRKKSNSSAGSGAAVMNFVCLSSARTHLLVVGGDQGNVNVSGADVVQAYVEYRSSDGRTGLSDATRNHLIELADRIDVRDIQGIYVPKRYLGLTEWDGRFVNKETLSFSIMFKSAQPPLEFIAMDLSDYVDWIEGLRVLMQHKMITPKMLGDIEMLTEVEVSNQMRAKGYMAKVKVKDAKKGSRKKILIHFERINNSNNNIDGDSIPDIPELPESMGDLDGEDEQDGVNDNNPDSEMEAGKGKEDAVQDAEALKKRIKRNASAVVMEQKVIEMFSGAFFERDRDLSDEQDEESEDSENNEESEASSSSSSSSSDAGGLSIDVSLNESDQMMLGVGMAAIGEEEQDNGGGIVAGAGAAWDEDEDDFDDDDAKVLMYVKLSQNRRNIMYRDSTDGVNILQLYSHTKSDQDNETGDGDLRMMPLSSVVEVESEDIKMQLVLRFKDGSEWTLQAVRKGDFTLWSDGLRYLIGQDIGAAILQSEILMIANNWFQENGYALLDGTVVVKVVLPHNNGSSSTIKIGQDETVEKLLQTICNKREIDPLDYYLHFADRPTPLDLGMGVLELNGKLLILSSMSSTVEDFSEGLATGRAMDNITSQKHMMRELGELAPGPKLGGSSSSSSGNGGMGVDFVKINFSLENFSVMKIDETTTIRQLLEQACQKRGLNVHNYQLILVEDPEYALVDEVAAASFSGREYLLVSRRQREEERVNVSKQYSQVRSRANSNVNQMPSRSLTEKVISSGSSLANRARRGSGAESMSKRSSSGTESSLMNSNSSSSSSTVLSSNPPSSADDPKPGLSALQNSVLVHASFAYQSMAVERGSVETYEDVLQHVCGITGRSFLDHDIRSMENERMVLTEAVNPDIVHLVLVNSDDEDFLWPTESDVKQFQNEFVEQYVVKVDQENEKERIRQMKEIRDEKLKESIKEEERRNELNINDVKEKAHATNGRDWTVADARVKSGYMKKKGHLVRNWKKRWFVLTVTGKLFYFKAIGDEEPAGCIDLGVAVIDDEGGKEGKNGWPFVISETTGKEKSYTLCTESRIDRRMWLDEIKKYI
eukprot:TRINITY_DN1888_c0_g3_i1.p1 TRINITY_DN1888_c0_g3~~TRINITY_DN1888_c0_g3_i1.p1  ORF type:complete len:1220 (+),score=477.79 TRINITY_DN1888_c0_g3_i1:241-3660(+)